MKMTTAPHSATLRTVLIILLAILLVAFVHWLLVHVDLEQWELLAVATTAVRI